jgi:hypothetical protein
MYHGGLSAQQATDAVVDMLRISYETFSASEKRFLSVKMSPEVRGDVLVLIQGFKNVILGGVYWA